MYTKTIQIIPFTDEKEKCCMWLGKFMARSVIKGYHVLRTSATKIPADEPNETGEKEISAIKLLNFTAYNKLIPAQEDTACFQIFE